MLEKFDTIYHCYRSFNGRYLPALQRSAMCVDTTYRSAGADISVGMADYRHIAPLEQRRVLAVALELGFVQLNLCDNQFLISTSRYKSL